MKRLMDFVKNRFKSLPMQKKMIISYTFPVVFFCILIDLLCFPVFFRNYEKELRNVVSQSCDQADNFISNYMNDMVYIKRLTADNTELNRIQSSDEFGQKQDLSDAYREFYRLNTAFCNIELSNETYRIGMYVPDAVLYSNNNYYFFPESELKARNDYDKLMRAVNQGALYFSPIVERKSSDPSVTESYMALFQLINVTNSKNITRPYVAKVEVSMNDLRQVLRNSNNTKNGLVYLINNDGNFICASDEPLYKSLKKTGALPVTKTEAWKQLKIGKTSYYTVWRQTEVSDWQIFFLIPKNEFDEQCGFIRILLLFMALVAAAAIAGVSCYLSRYYVGRLTKLNQKMKNLQNGELNQKFDLNKDASGDEIDEIYRNFNYMTKEIRRLMQEKYQIGKEVVSAEFKALQAQINPHFLYNTLDLINWGAMDYGAVEVAEIARNLGQFYQLSLNHGKATVTIENELKHVQSFVNIENVHFEGAINLDIEVPAEIRQYACLNIILQPFVENAIVHGIAEYPDIVECNIIIRARQEAQDILFEIHDDGPGIDEKQLAGILDESVSCSGNGYGVKNINSRLKLCYGEGYGVTYKSRLSEGTTACIRIPAMTYEQLDGLLK